MCGKMDAEDARGMPAGWVRSSVVGRGTATRRKCAHMIPFFFLRTTYGLLGFSQMRSLLPKQSL